MSKKGKKLKEVRIVEGPFEIIERDVTGPTVIKPTRILYVKFKKEKKAEEPKKEES